MQKTQFGGEIEKRSSLLGVLEKRFVSWGLPLIPSWIQTYHLTFATLIFSAFIFYLSYLARGRSEWLLVICLVVVAQYLTDLFDGSLGRYRKTGLVKWGFMMDHLFDFIFAGALVAGWVFLVPDSQSAWVVVTMLAWAGSMVNSFLYLAATNDFKVSYAGLGPTEFRVVVIVGYIVAYLWGPSFFSTFVPVIAVGSLLVLAAVLYDSHTSLWQLDMHAKPSKKKSNTGYGRIKA